MSTCTWTRSATPTIRYWHQTYRSRIQDIYDISAKGMLQFGVTTALDLGAYADDIAAYKKKVDAGQVASPRLKITGGFITNLSDEYIKGWHRGYQTANARTPEEARAAALKWIGYNVDVLKAYTGLNGEQVKAISEEAHKRGLWVTGHVEGPENAIARIEAGQDAIEHLGGFSRGGVVPPEVIAAILKHRTVIVPTLVTSAAQLDAVQWPEFWSDNQRAKSSMPPDIWADVRRSLEHPERVQTNFGGYVRWKSAEESKAVFQQLREAGVTMLVGTDASTPLNFKTDAMWREMDLMVQYGVPPMEVLATATRRNADYMKMGNQVGTITRGKLADIIVIDGNPLVSMRDLQERRGRREGRPCLQGSHRGFDHDFERTGCQQAAAMRCAMRIWRTCVFAIGVLALIVVSAQAQTLGSAIVGVVRDQTGGVLPGVTVEVSSPALIGGVQTLVTDSTGQYPNRGPAARHLCDLVLAARVPQRARRRRRASRRVYRNR